MTAILRVFILFSVLATVVCGDAFAYSIQRVGGNPLKWPSNMKTISYVIHQDGSADIQDGSDFTQVQKGFADWQNNACTYLQFNYTGTSTGKNVTALGSWSNGKNEIVWIEDSSWGYGSYVLGVTAPIFSQNGAISEADIAFNGYLHTWSTSGSGGAWGNKQDVLNVGIHEQGHFFGMQHVLGGYSESDPPTMAPTADPYLKTATLEPDDIKGICYLYPSGTHTCSSDDDCPYIVDQYSNGQEYYKEKVKCEGGSCGGTTTNIPTGGKGLGESCSGDIDCEAPLFCQNTGQGPVCAQECVPSQNNCPSGFECFPYSNAENLGVCLPGSGSGGSSGTTPVGGDCNYSSDCETGLCVQQADGSGNICMKPCDVSAPNCPAGESCQPLSMGSNSGVCVPGGESSTDLPNGSVCQNSGQCASGLCVGMPGSNLFYCRATCDPADPSACGANETCFEIQGGGGACLPDEQSSGGGTTGGTGTIDNGEPCTNPSECKSGLCVGFEEGGGYFCREPCDSNTGSGCSADENCLPMQDDTGEGACVPKDDDGLLGNGSACSSSTECKSGLCVGAEDGAAKCRNSCDVVTGAGCEEGENCQPLSSDDGTGACFPASEGKATGESCTSSEQCFSGQCVGSGDEGFCTGECESTADCPCGMACADTSLGMLCYPSGTKVQCVGDGDPCETDGECVSLSCNDGTCETSCSIFEPGDCPVGQGCKRLGLGSNGLCKPQGSTENGERCDSDVDCESLYCVLMDNISYCQDPCSLVDGQGCSSGQECKSLEGMGDIGYCFGTPDVGGGSGFGEEFDSMDVDGDGRVSWGEFEGTDSEFTRLDANGDGKLSAAEYHSGTGGFSSSGGGGCHSSAPTSSHKAVGLVLFLLGLAIVRRREQRLSSN